MNEALYKRSKPTSQFEYEGKVLILSEQILQKTYYLLSPYLSHNVESACFWYGIREDNVETVKAVGIVDQKNHKGFFEIPSEGLIDMASCLEDTGWTNLAQIHTHPGKNVEHSGYDDIYVNSRRALSLVLPLYGKPQRDFLSCVGVHQFHSDYWHLLKHNDKMKRVKVIGNEKGVIIDARTFQVT